MSLNGQRSTLRRREIREFIMDALTEQSQAADGWAVDRSAVVDEVVETRGVRREEIEGQIDYLIDENGVGEEGSDSLIPESVSTDLYVIDRHQFSISFTGRV
ncbi:hypothetical protein HT576_22370 [Haloterrigena sp. SYSU A121-1]|uniref:Uncharacterized protein n=1 Tax=Haloterrigena gelatinilytica TaxID=2741724 RepID=A0A8J8GP50_9EURY|nr:hypothetical protein [Haloterrigena gelatinilytica]NUB93728.1 hypothetical protein [Haloterrigena gelatinilytica]